MTSSPKFSHTQITSVPMQLRYDVCRFTCCRMPCSRSLTRILSLKRETQAGLGQGVTNVTARNQEWRAPTGLVKPLPRRPSKLRTAHPSRVSAGRGLRRRRRAGAACASQPHALSAAPFPTTLLHSNAATTLHSSAALVLRFVALRPRAPLKCTQGPIEG
jgi:hypothetical protein